jgi:hypothetical protein
MDYSFQEDVHPPNVTLFRGKPPVDTDDDSIFMDLDLDEDEPPVYSSASAFAMEVEDSPHPNVTLFRGRNPAPYDEDDDNSIQHMIEEEEEEMDYEEDEERKKETKKQKCGPTFKFVEMNYHDTQVTYPKRCAMCNNSMKYSEVYEMSCIHALCTGCYNFHEDNTAERCEILCSGYLSCPVRSCRKTIKNVTGYTKRKDEKLFL